MKGSAAPELLADALGYLDRGWSCVPAVSRPRGRTKKVQPIIPYIEYRDRRLPTEAELCDWFARHGVNGVAILTGRASGALAARDFDSRKVYERWSERYPTLARTLPTSIGLRGPHVWFCTNLQRTFSLEGGEFRGKGVTLAPHSKHASGKRYEWLIPLPKRGPLPFVEHQVFTQAHVAEIAENAECHLSAISALSATSQPSSSLPPDPIASASPISACSAMSAPSTADEVISSTLPLVSGERNNKILALARGLKFNCALASAETHVLRALVRQWHGRALTVIDTKDFDTTWADFLHAWDRARLPLGLDLVDAAALRVDPHELPAAADDYSNLVTKRLIGLCAALAELNGCQGRFFLSSHDVAKRLRVAPVMAWRLLRMLVRDGVLEELEVGNERRATRYRFIGSPIRQEADHE